MLTGDKIAGQDTVMISISDDLDIPPPRHHEVRVAIKRLKNNKAAGADGLPAELFKAGGNELIVCMH